jgi:hypothetical protein
MAYLTGQAYRPFISEKDERTGVHPQGRNRWNVTFYDDPDH